MTAEREQQWSIFEKWLDGLTWAQWHVYCGKVVKSSCLRQNSGTGIQKTAQELVGEFPYPVPKVTLCLGLEYASFSSRLRHPSPTHFPVPNLLRGTQEGLSVTGKVSAWRNRIQNSQLCERLAVAYTKTNSYWCRTDAVDKQYASLKQILWCCKQPWDTSILMTHTWIKQLTSTLTSRLSLKYTTARRRTRSSAPRVYFLFSIIFCDPPISL